MTRSHIAYLSVAILSVFVLGIFIGNQYIDKGSFGPHALRESQLNSEQTYKLIDPLIALNDSTITNNKEYDALEKSIRTSIDTGKSQRKLETASLIFIDEKTGTGFSINPDEKYTPASLLKVPTMIAYFKLASKNPDILDKKILHTGQVDYNTQEHIVSPIQLEKNTNYSVYELIQHMVKYSDNNAAQLLIDNLNASESSVDTFNKLFKDMGISEIRYDSDFITVHTYSLFLRILYNATYLDREWSQKALELLTQTDFSRGLESGVPNGIPVAQKFGEFTVQTPHGESLKKELHDCGIIYYPNHPYLLCIMTKGYDFTDLEQFIASVSHSTFQYYEKTYPAAR